MFGKPKEKEVDLNTPLEDDVFVPGPAPPGLEKPWRIHRTFVDRLKARGGCCLTYKFNHLPEFFEKASYPDPLIGSKHVVKLRDDNFRDIVLKKNGMLVMYYQSVDEKLPANTEWSKKQLIKAARTMRRGNHGFAAVDCTKETDLCADISDLRINKNRTEFPFFNIYSKGVAKARFDTLNAEDMKRHLARYSPSTSLFTPITNCGR